MKTITLTDRELAVISHAVEMSNDMHTDMMFDDTTVDLFPKEDSPTVFTTKQAKVLRKELVETTENLIAIRTLMAKLGLSVNDSGYSV